ncbi:MAG: tRNA (adenosine(37)-N6)-threonylcarbamoyltransferase complex ATPase subunit type 1 TsaE [Candidatus Zambryskibacteria bacterium CG_4_9_14_3_um_filter_42_9]|nr:MAG: tRNA (adenosine(37)-N6)-threonylcarbamoyltransferase complex ATPase subunit type 1 TsaE [Candidatus Zambryskibacteria bacterium CG_4_9_14_3_um_filter_42_9]
MISRSLEETSGIAQNFLKTLSYGSSAEVVILSGDLGSGKTAFTQEVGKILGVAGSMQSPTFVIEKIYAIDFNPPAGRAGNFKRLIHIDAYRLEYDSELLHLGWEEIIKEPENLIFLEWPENVASIIPREAKKVSFKFIDETTREIQYEN